MTDGWIDQVREWTANYFSVEEPEGDIVTLLRKVADAVDALAARYAQYRDTPPAGPAIIVTVNEIRSWGT